MKNLMKSLLTTLSAVVAMATIFTTQAIAQPGGGEGGPQRERLTAEQTAYQQSSRLKKELDLTRAEEKKVYAIYLKAAKEQEKAREEMRKNRAENNSGERSNVNREEMMKQQQASREAINNEVRATLTEEQAVKFDALLKKQAERQAEQQANRQQGPRQQQ